MSYMEDTGSCSDVGIVEIKIVKATINLLDKKQ